MEKAAEILKQRTAEAAECRDLNLASLSFETAKM